ncbi:hypothetical protein LMG26411_04874 [Cupriavidus numazuensis]|uniref:Uncharacterized protein n=1 Tax=Cupriavidus numazuensis TaxID=221992 RepID=A0ABN7QAQ8_9BURK|nr:hypothetical protein LMG26411_04874 [Cupriavidus numazuensis]
MLRKHVDREAFCPTGAIMSRTVSRELGAYARLLVSNIEQGSRLSVYCRLGMGCCQSAERQQACRTPKLSN